MQGDDLRYSRVADIMQVIFRMRSRRQGLRPDEIADELSATRRTAERVRDVILRVFPYIDEIPSNDRYKRWGFSDWAGQRSLASGLIGFSEDELLALETIKKQAEQNGEARRVEILEDILRKLYALKQESKDSISHQEEHLKKLIAAEGFAVSQFSRQTIDFTQLAMIREGLTSSQLLLFSYTNRAGEHSERNVEPYGVLYNHKNYLVAKDRGIIKLFDLSRITNLKLGEAFEVDKSFNLQEFAQGSFGVYQEEPITVKLLFTASASLDAKNYHFHPTQEIAIGDDGQLEVTFTAGGERAILWELFKWGTSVTILKPKSLRNAYIKELNAILNMQAKNRRII